MKKFFKLLLKLLISIIGLVVVLAIVAFVYLNRNFLNFAVKDKYAEDPAKEITFEGFKFRDLNRNGKLDTYEDNRQPVEARVKDLLGQLTPDEKLHLLTGSGMKSGAGFDTGKEGVAGAVGTTVAVPRLGIPVVYLSDGPAGLRISPTRKNDPGTYYATAFPIGTLLASTWDVDLAEKVGEAMGSEALEYGIDVILGPGANIHRNPLCGRNFEYFSEDPVVTGNIGAAIVNGVQSKKVGTSVKHFACNNQETNRFNNNVIVSERALREIYLKGFEIIVKKAKPYTVMSSYNLLNGVHTNESRELLTDILRKEWGFKGLVMSDWFGGINPPVEISAGNDLLMPGTRNQYKSLRKAAKKGDLATADIDTSVARVLRFVLNSKRMGQYRYGNNPALKDHGLLTRQSASEGMVLLKNDETLPLQGIKNIALFGVTSFQFIAGGTGSGNVNKAYTISLEEGLANAGFQIDPASKKAFDDFKAAHPKDFAKKSGMAALMSSVLPPEMLPSESLLAQCKKSADMAVITIGRNSGEGYDRIKENDFNLSATEQNLISTVCKTFHEAGRKVVVILNIGGVIETASWKEQPDAILLAWQGGQEGGNSVADILSGKVSPCGKLTMTFPVALEKQSSMANFPTTGEPMGVNSILLNVEPKPEAKQVKDIDFTRYEEGIYVGYRHFEKNKIAVSYPFGFGLSYTSFVYDNMDAKVSGDTVQISLTVKNTGPVSGKEIVEIYVSKPDTKIDRPVQELKSFAKTPLLGSGESVTLSFSIPVTDLSYWDEAKPGWVVEKGGYTINASSSSGDIRLSKDISL
jgi:beta-glucosidase